MWQYIGTFVRVTTAIIGTPALLWTVFGLPGWYNRASYNHRHGGEFTAEPGVLMVSVIGAIGLLGLFGLVWCMRTAQGGADGEAKKEEPKAAPEPVSDVI